MYVHAGIYIYSHIVTRAFSQESEALQEQLRQRADEAEVLRRRSDEAEALATARVQELEMQRSALE